MKVLLYFEDEELIGQSGIGRAMRHQKQALEYAGIDYTTNPRSQDYDILHINTTGAASQIVIHNARKMGKPVIYHAHSTKEDFRNSFNFSNLVAPFFNHRIVSLYRSADALITPTPYSKRLLEGYGLKMPVYAISNGICLEDYAKDTERENAFREYFHLSPQEKVIISVGLLFERKGLIDFMEVARNMPEYTFIWFGSLSRILLSSKVIKALDRKPDNVILPGYISGDIIKGAFSGADVFFFPSYEETEGIVVLEALASGQTAVLRDIGAYDAWAVSGKNCWLGTCNKDFETILRGVIEGRLPRTGSGGYQVAADRNIRIIGQQLKAVYESVLRRSAQAQ